MIHEEFYDWLLNTKNVAEQTAIQYTRRIDHLTTKENEPKKLSKEQISDFLRKRSTSVSNYNQYLSALKAYEEFYGQTQGAIDVTGGLTYKPQPQRLPKPLTKREISLICAAIPDTIEGIRDRAIIELMYSGLRNNEVCSLQLSWFYDRNVRVIGKGNKERVVPLNRVCWNYVVEYAILYHGDHTIIEAACDSRDLAFELLKKKRDGLLFFTNSGIPMYTRAIRRLVNYYAEIAGVDGAHPHRFRHSAASHILDSGFSNLIYLKNVMGHAKLSTTEQYVLVSNASRETLLSHHPRELDFDGIE